MTIKTIFLINKTIQLPMRKREKMEDVSRTKKHWLVFGAISFMYMASLGLVNNTIGVYYTPVSESLQILTGTFAMNATISAIFTAIGGLFSFRVVERIGLKKNINVGRHQLFCRDVRNGAYKQRSDFQCVGDDSRYWSRLYRHGPRSSCVEQLV